MTNTNPAKNNKGTDKAPYKPESDPNFRDPITNAPGAHPVGTGIGAAAGGAMGLGIGAAVGGPIGAAVGAAAGAVAGGYAGKATAASIDPTVEDEYWSKNYHTRPYVDRDAPYDLYAPAYRFGWESRAKRGSSPSIRFDDIEMELEQEWSRLVNRGALGWQRARLAVRDAWDRFALDRAEGEGMIDHSATSDAACGDCAPPTKRGPQR